MYWKAECEACGAISLFDKTVQAGDGKRVCTECYHEITENGLYPFRTCAEAIEELSQLQRAEGEHLKMLQHIPAEDREDFLWYERYLSQATLGRRRNWLNNRQRILLFDYLGRSIGFFYLRAENGMSYEMANRHRERLEENHLPVLETVIRG